MERSCYKKYTYENESTTCYGSKVMIKVKVSTDRTNTRCPQIDRSQGHKNYSLFPLFNVTVHLSIIQTIHTIIYYTMFSPYLISNHLIFTNIYTNLPAQWHILVVRSFFSHLPSRYQSRSQTYWNRSHWLHYV